MKAIIGLGNPGSEYARTRHNAGWDAVQILAGRLNIDIKKIKCRSTIGEGIYEGEKIVLVHPQTFMNLSGFSFVDIMNWYKLELSDILVLSDDIDLPFGQVRLRAKGGPGTHNGLRHIIQCTASGDFPRVRIGMGAPDAGWDLKDWVLGHFNTEEDRKTAFDMYNTAADAALCWVKEGINNAMNKFNKKPGKTGNAGNTEEKKTPGEKDTAAEKKEADE
ncbi:MAG: aminoacyl-tRNA hydrolase [Clostridiales bacterium]|nr:aminoacyl-tRNA hydrolase [Clostridiales bacterium]